MNEQEVKQMLWSKSPYKAGDVMILHPDYVGGGQPVIIRDIGYFEQNQLFPFEFECELKGGEKAWIKGHALIKHNEPPWREEGALLKEWRKNQGRVLRIEAIRRKMNPTELSAMERGLTKPVWPAGINLFVS